MSKLISLSIQAIVFTFFLVYVQGLFVKGPSQITKVIESLGQTNESPIDASEGSLQTVAARLMPLLAGKTGLANLTANTSDAVKKTLPAGPSTLICYQKSGGRAAEPSVTKLPPGARVVMIDGRMQVFYPGVKPNAAPPIQHNRGCKKTTFEAEFPRTDEAEIRKYLGRLTTELF